MLIMGGLIVALCVYYKPVWLSYKHLIQIHRDSFERSRKPNLLPSQPSYHYQQDKTRYVLTWFIELCGQRALFLRRKKGFYPWSVCRGSASAQNDLAQQEDLPCAWGSTPISLKALFIMPDKQHRNG